MDVRAPSVGRIVMFYERQNQPYAAIITAVLESDAGIVNLCVFDPYGPPSGRTSINRRTQPSQTYVWDWPEIV